MNRPEQIDYRNKTITLERMKRSILNEVRSGDQEGRCLAQYKREMELLQQEKMSHVEELRQIHADINAMETVIKQTEESMTRKLSNASRLHEDYRPLKAEVDLLRRQCLGLERLPDLHEEEGSPITPDRFPALPSGGAAAPAPRALGGFLPPAAPRKPPPPPPAFRSALDQDFITVSLSALCGSNQWLSPQTAAPADEVVPVVPPADTPQRAHLSALQGQESLAEPQEAQEEIVSPPPPGRRPAPDRSHAPPKLRLLATPVTELIH
ncbi:hypothetical protein HF086_002674 [Spodoptera exigua]|uniref:Uncharacterized protein n=1 Tax=Spodoptera exigua TaxID=7107 RepID=A0A922MZG4_SPOEX|nr:hypothetical protein HF086_002674 [Spodoptera exigua]